MTIKISAWGSGIGAIAMAGAILLAVLGNSNWPFFFAGSLFAFAFGALVRKL